MKAFRWYIISALVLGLLALFYPVDTQSQKSSASQNQITICMKADEASVEQETSTGQKKTEALPSLQIKRVFLKDDTIRVTLKNMGKKPISSSAYARITVQIKSKTLNQSKFLSKLDPKGAAFQRGGQEITFDTGLRLTAAELVKVTLQGVEPKASKNVRLVPPVTVQAMQKAPSKEVIGTLQRQKEGEPPTGTVKALPETLMRPEGPKEEPVLKRTEEGIRILRPTPLDSFRLGSEVRVEFDFGSDDRGTTSLMPIDRVEFLRDSHGEGVIHTVRFDPERGVRIANDRSVRIPIPEDFEPADDYHVKLWAIESGDTSLPRVPRYGVSDRFTIRAEARRVAPVTECRGAGMCVDVLGGGFYPGASLTVRYSCYACELDTPEDNVYIHTEGLANPVDFGSYQVFGHVSGREGTVTLTIPRRIHTYLGRSDAVPAALVENFVVTVFEPGCWGQSAPFPIWSEPGRSDFRVISPSGGERWERGSTQEIIWSVANTFGVETSGRPDARFLIDLLRGGRVVDQVDTSGMRYDHASRTCSVVWDVPLEIYDRDLGDDYRIKIKAHDYSERREGLVTAESPEPFTICSDCTLYTRWQWCDYWIEGVRLRDDVPEPITYNPEASPPIIPGTASLLVLIGWNGRAPQMSTCRPYIKMCWNGGHCQTQESRHGNDFSRITYSLPWGLTPGSQNFGFSVEIISGHESVPLDRRRRKRLCDQDGSNNRREFSLRIP